MHPAKHGQPCSELFMVSVRRAARTEVGGSILQADRALLPFAAVNWGAVIQDTHKLWASSNSGHLQIMMGSVNTFVING